MAAYLTSGVFMGRKSGLAEDRYNKSTQVGRIGAASLHIGSSNMIAKASIGAVLHSRIPFENINC